jgi:DNA-binding LacI/PurR family transcriptional regulator
MSRSFSQARVRVGLREVAAAAKVCVMTVSLALRDNPRISAATRDRIKRLANELGYHPDPELSRLMNHLRASRTARGRIGVALIDFYPSAGFAENVYNAKIRSGAERRAEELGFSVTPMHAADYKMSLSNLLKVIRARGLEGALILPSVVPLELDTSVNWNGISVVATSKSILAPRFHCVVPDQFGNAMRLLENLQGQGHRRICAVFDELFDERTGHNFTAAVNWKPADRVTLIVPQAASQLDRAELVASWLAEQRPDAVFAQSDAVMAAIPRLRAVKPRMDFQVISLGQHNCAGFSYVDERADLVGSGAIDLLGGMMYYHETGIPVHPRTTLIDGKLVLSRKVVGRAPALAPAADGMIADRGLRISD